MRIQTDCCCGATFTLDDSGRDDVCTRNQFDQRHAAWNALHAGCPALYASRPGQCEASAPSPVEGCPVLQCALVAGHEGAHCDNTGASFSLTAPPSVHKQEEPK